MFKKDVVFTYILIVVAMMIWGMSFVWYKVVFSFGFKPILTIVLRLIISLFFLFLVTLISKSFQRVPFSEWRCFFVLALFEPFGYFFGESFGVNLVSSSVAAIIIATIPLFSPIVAYLFFKERLTAFNIIGVLVSFLGLFFVLVEPNNEEVTSIQGVLFLFFSVLMALFYGVFIKRLSVKYSPITIVLMQNMIGLVYFIPFFIIMESDSLNTLQINQSSILNLLYLGVLGSSLAFVFYTRAIHKIGMVKANVFSNTIPIFTLIFSFFVLQEQLTLKKLIGIGIVLVGLFFSQIGKKKQE